MAKANAAPTAITPQLGVGATPHEGGNGQETPEHKEFISLQMEHFHKIQDGTALLKKDLLFDRAPATLTTGQMADQVAWLREIKSTMEAREKQLLEVLKVRHATELKTVQDAWTKNGNKVVLALKGHVSPGIYIEYVEQYRLDGDKLIEEFGQEWVDERKGKIGFFQAKKGKVL